MIDQDAAAQHGSVDPSDQGLIERLAAFLASRGVLDELTLHRALRAHPVPRVRKVPKEQPAQLALSKSLRTPQ